MPHEPRQLLREVQAVSKLADPVSPQQVNQRAFDAAAKQHERYASLPLARDIARYFGHPWRDVLAAAHLPAKARAKWVGAQSDENDQRWITPEHIAYVLKLAARRSQRETLTIVQYEKEREQLLAEHQARHPSSKRLRLPTADQICTATQSELYDPKGVGAPMTKTWNRALELAALPVTERRTNTRSPSGQPIHPVKLIELYYQEKGELPTAIRLGRFADAQGLPYTRLTTRQAWAAVVNDWKRKRAARGLPAPCPPAPTTHGEIALRLFRLPTRPKKRSHSRWRSREKCIAVVVRYLTQLPAGKHGTAKSYGAWAREQGDAAPSTTTLQRHGGWLQISELARERLMHKK